MNVPLNGIYHFHFSSSYLLGGVVICIVHALGYNSIYIQIKATVAIHVGSKKFKDMQLSGELIVKKNVVRRSRRV